MGNSDTLGCGELVRLLVSVGADVVGWCVRVGPLVGMFVGVVVGAIDGTRDGPVEGEAVGSGSVGPGV